VTPQRDADSSPGEQETWAEHRAALEATLFRPNGDPAVVLELRDGVLRRAGA
jgi:hypothetical protein